MPGVTVGVYAGAQTAGTEVSSTYEGRHLTVREDELIHPYIADGFVNKGDPVVLCDAGVPTSYGRAVGVAFRDGAAVADWIAIDTEGIWNLTVYAEDDAGNAAIEIGDLLYIRAGNLPGAADADGTGDGEISKINDGATQVPFGFALGSMVAGGSGVIAVKVHWNPSMDNAKRTYYTAPDGEYAYGKHHTTIFAGGQNTGLEYFNQQVTGVMDGNLYGLGTWLEIAAGFTSNASILCPFEVGIYDAGATLTTSRVVMIQIQGIFASAVDLLHIFRLNIAAAGGAITALFAAANPGSIGFLVSATTGSTKNGDIPIADVVGTGVVWVRTYDAAG